MEIEQFYDLLSLIHGCLGFLPMDVVGAVDANRRSGPPLLGLGAAEATPQMAVRQQAARAPCERLPTCFAGMRFWVEVYEEAYSDWHVNLPMACASTGSPRVETKTSA